MFCHCEERSNPELKMMWFWGTKIFVPYSRFLVLACRDAPFRIGIKGRNTLRPFGIWNVGVL